MLKWFPVHSVSSLIQLSLPWEEFSWQHTLLYWLRDPHPCSLDGPYHQHLLHLVCLHLIIRCVIFRSTPGRFAFVLRVRQVCHGTQRDRPRTREVLPVDRYSIQTGSKVDKMNKACSLSTSLFFCCSYNFLYFWTIILYSPIFCCFSESSSSSF